MPPQVRIEQLRSRIAPVEMTEEQFRSLGYELVDRIAALQSSMRTRPVTPAESPVNVRAALAANRKLPEEGKAPTYCCGMRLVCCLSIRC